MTTTMMMQLSVPTCLIRSKEENKIVKKYHTFIPALYTTKESTVFELCKNIMKGLDLQAYGLPKRMSEY